MSRDELTKKQQGNKLSLVISPYKMSKQNKNISYHSHDHTIITSVTDDTKQNSEFFIIFLYRKSVENIVRLLIII